MQNKLVSNVLGLMGASFGLNGASMMLAPDFWFQHLPGVIDTGPFNHHFVRDVGAAYLSVAAAFFLARRYPRAGAQLLLVAFIFLGLHGMVHVMDTLAGRMSWHHFANDSVTVILPALLTLWFAGFLGKNGSLQENSAVQTNVSLQIDNQEVQS